LTLFDIVTAYDIVNYNNCMIPTANNKNSYAYAKNVRYTARNF